MRARTSAKLTPAAATRIRTSPGPGSGPGASRTSSTEGSPILGIQTCFTGSSSPDESGRDLAFLLELQEVRERAPRGEAVERGRRVRVGDLDERLERARSLRVGREDLGLAAEAMRDVLVHLPGRIADRRPVRREEEPRSERAEARERV